MEFSLIIIAIVSGIIAGMGLGGGSIFILLTTIFNLLPYKEAQAYNLIMFIIIGISSTITNLKNNSIDKNILKKLIIPVCMGSICGIFISKIIDEKFLKKLFYYFMLVLGIYEIISSLKSMIFDKNNTGYRKE